MKICTCLNNNNNNKTPTHTKSCRSPNSNKCEYMLGAGLKKTFLKVSFDVEEDTKLHIIQICRLIWV